MASDLRAEELNTMSTGEDETSPSLNGRLRPRKSTTTPSPQNKTTRKTEGKLAQDRPKRTSTPSKASPSKQDDLAVMSDTSSALLVLCLYCDRKFYARSTATKHARRMHLSTSKQDNFIKCLYCNHSDAESNAIIKHMVDNHPNQYFACLDCHTRFPSTIELTEHKFNVCEKQKPSYRNKLRQKTSAGSKKNPKKVNKDKKSTNSNEDTQYTDDSVFNGIVISCEPQPSEMHDAADIEDKITTNVILPPSKSLANGREKNAVIVLDDLQWNKRIPPNFSFHNTDADQILSRLGVVHRSPRVGESRKDLIRLMDEPNEKFERCFDTSFYSKVTKNVQDNLTKFLDGSFNLNTNKDIIKTRKSKTSVVINTAEGFPILLAHEQFSRNLFDGFIPRAMAPKHKWKWDTTENDKTVVMLLDQTKRDNHVNNCIITLISSLDMWTQLRMKSKFEEIFKTTPTAKNTEKQNIISMELKEILESRDIPTTSSQVVQYKGEQAETREGSELPAYLGLSPMTVKCELQPAVLSGEWVRPRCYVCCACGEQTQDARALSTHLSSQHPNAQVQHYEIVGETLLSADILKHLYVPPSQMSNRTRPPRGFRDCTKCKKSVTIEDLHQHMLDCAGDTPTVRRKCRYRPFGVRRRRPRLPDNTIRKKMRKDIRSRHRQKAHIIPRPRIRTEVGDAETIRKMIADLPAKRNRITPSNVLRPRRNILKAKKPTNLRASEDKKSNKSNTVKNLSKPKKIEITKKRNDTDDSSTVDEDDQPLKLSVTRASTRTANSKDTLRCQSTTDKKLSNRKDPNMRGTQENYYNIAHEGIDPRLLNPFMYNHENMLAGNLLPPEVSHCNVFHAARLRPNMYHPYHVPNHHLAFQQSSYHHRLSMEQLQLNPHSVVQVQHNHLLIEAQRNHLIERQLQRNRFIEEQVHPDPQKIEQAQLMQMALEKEHRNQLNEQIQHNQLVIEQIRHNQPKKELAQHNQLMIEHSHQRIDVLGAGPSNIRQHSNRDDNNMDGGKDRPVREEGDDGNHNNDLAQAPNVPLKHSIASLTSHSKYRDTTAPYYPYLVPSKIHETHMYESNYHQEFENEVTAEKLYKPPLPNVVIKPHEQSFSPNDSTNEPGGHLSSPEESVKSQISDLKSSSPNDTSKFRDLGKQPPLPHSSIKSAEPAGKHLPNDSIDLQDPSEQQPPLNYPIDPQELCGQPPLQNLPKESVVLDEEQIRIENDKSKLNKTRKGLNDCIAMLRTKKGLRLDLATSECGDDETIDSEIIDPETLDTEISVNLVSDPPLVVNKTIEENDAEKAINLTPAQVFSRSSLSEQSQDESGSENRIPCNSTRKHKSPLKNDDAYVQQRKVSVEKIRELSRTRSASLTEYKMASQAVTQTEQSLCVKDSPKQPSDVNPDKEMTMRRNSDEGPTLDEPFHHHTVSKTPRSLIDFKFPNPAHNTLKAQETITEGNEEVDKQVYEYNQRIETEMQNQQNVSESTLALKNVSVPVTQVAYDTEIPVQQTNASLTSRRTRRKPVKKIPISEQQMAFYYERNTSQKQTTAKHAAVSPLHHGSHFAASSKGPNTHLVSASCLPTVSSSVESLPLKIPTGSRVRRESYKRVLSSSETGVDVVHNRDSGSQSKMFKKSLETHAENIMNMRNVRRHSIELANAPPKTVNYDMLMEQAYREHCEKSFLNISTSNRGNSYSRKTTQDDSKKQTLDDACYDRLNELHSHQTSVSTAVSATQETHRTMQVNTKTSEVTKKTALTRETQDNYKVCFENEQLRQKKQVTTVKNLISSNPESKVDYLMKGSESFENKFIGQERKATTQKFKVLDNSSHRLGIRRTSGDYYTRSSPYQSNALNVNVLNISDHPLEMGSDESKETYDNPLLACHESVASFLVPALPYSNNMYSSIPVMQSISYNKPNAEEVTPLDLSYDPKDRKEKTSQSCNKSSELFQNRFNILITNENNCDESAMTVNLRNNYDELRNKPQHPPLPCNKPEDRPNRELVYESSSDASLGGTEKNKISQEMSINQKDIMPNKTNKLHTSTDIVQPNMELSNDSLYEKYYENTKNKIISTVNVSNSSSERLLSPLPESNYFIPRHLQSSDPTICNRQESMQEKTFLENKKIARASTQGSIVLDTKFEDNALTKSSPLTILGNPNVKNVNQYETSPDMVHHITSLNEQNKTNEISNQYNQMQKANSGDKTVQICDQDVLSQNDYISFDQDAETARKFAMLPEELVKILGTIPKNHRNQLLNVLPQYVSTPVSTVRNEKTNTVTATCAYKNNQQTEYKQASEDSNRLSVNTDILPSSIIPKKRHSPSQSRGGLNSNEIQSSLPVLRPSLTPTLSQRYQNDSSVEKNDSESLAIDPFIAVETSKLLEKNFEDTKINVDLSDPENMSENKNLSKSAEIAVFSSITKDLPHLPAPKVKHCNEQTASLRAVRIKTTSARKSLSDEKKLLASYKYKTNTIADEEFTNPLQIINPQPYSYRISKDFEYEKDKFNTQEESDHNADGLLRDSTGQNANNNLQDESEPIGSAIIYNNITAENNEHLTPSLSNCLAFSQNENKILHNTSQASIQFNKEITLEPSAVALQSTNTVVDHFLGQMKSTTISDDGNHNDLITVQKINLVSCNETKEELLNTTSLTQSVTSDNGRNSYTSELTSILPVEAIETTEENKCYDTNEDKQNLSSDSPQLNLNKASQDETFENTSVSSCSLLEPLSPIDEKSNEEDSEDDVSLAVIKQKHCAQPSDTSGLETPTTQIFSFKTDNKEKRNQSKSDSKRLKNKLSKNSESICEDTLISDNNTINDVEPTVIEVVSNDKEIKSSRNKKLIRTPLENSTTDVENDKINNEINEADVNKENNVAENINKIKEDDLNLIPERNPIECQLENYNDKSINNEYKDTPNINTSIELQPEENTITVTEDIQDLRDVKVSCDFETTETCSSVIKSPIQVKNIIKKTPIFNDKSIIECDYSSDTESKNESNLFTINATSTSGTNEPNPMTDDIELTKLTEVSAKDSTKTLPATSEDSIVSDFQACSEICKISELPLRRSRRGKSMYVDSSSIKDNEHIVQVEEADKKTPLTMKRLILSRVERDKKRISESSVLEKNIIATNDIHLIDSEEADVSCTKKGKVTKRKKPPHSRRKSKKIKPISAHQYEEEFSDHSNINGASESNTSILRELLNPENKIDENDTANEDVNCCMNPDNTNDNATSVLENSTLVDNEKICEVVEHDIIEVEETNTPGKRKLKVTDSFLSKSKKIKYHKSQSDFDSDDEKVLLETKQKMVVENVLNVGQDSDFINKCAETLDKEVSDGKSFKTNDEMSDAIPEHNTQQTPNATSMVVENHITCYNRLISNKESRSSSTSLKDQVNYDPYDIDFEDMIETSEPMINKKSKNIHAEKLKQDIRLTIKIEKSSLKISKHTFSKINNESDSDSSKSDVPLQKYVIEKALQSDLRSKKNKNTTISLDNVKKGEIKAEYQKSDNAEVKAVYQKSDKTEVKAVNQKSDNTKQILENSVIINDDKTSSSIPNIEISRSHSKGKKKSTKRVNKDSVCEGELPVKDHNLNTNNNVTVDEASQKPQNKHKKSRRAHAARNVDSSNVSKEDEQLQSDKFMENFGFYSERIPRKSNLLASKKISETFHMISNESEDSFLGCKEKSSKKSSQNESKKRSEMGAEIIVSQDSRAMTENDTHFVIQSTGSKMEDCETTIPPESYNVTGIDDIDLDTKTTQQLEKNEVRHFKNDLFSGLKKAPEEDAARNCDVADQNLGNVDNIGQDPKVSVSHIDEGCQKIDADPESIVKTIKNCKPKQAGVKSKLYPEIEEIDMFEDKFDKIKRKRRSQAVAAKQVQHIVEINTSVKSRKQIEKKKTSKSTKKNNQSTQVPTKGALKGFEGIKISIPTHDLNMPANVSPPRQQKKRKRNTGKRRKEISDSESNCSGFDEKEKIVLERDIYEFKDSEDTELFDLRPSTVMDRFRSMHKKNNFKNKDKGKGDMEKEKHKAREKGRKAKTKEKDLMKVEKEKRKEREKYPDAYNERKQNKFVTREESRCKEKDIQKELNYGADQLINRKEKCGKHNENKSTLDDGTSTKRQKCNHVSDNKKESDNAIASTSNFVPDRMDESDYESELSSPEGKFIFYTSEDVNCVCPSDNDSDESDIERGCGRLNCIYKNRNADKNAAIENIFKNNAVRCEKTDINESEKPRPDLDQLFDSLFETKSNNSEISANPKNSPEQTEQAVSRSKVVDYEENRTSISPVSQHDLIVSKQGDHTGTSNKDIISIFDESFSTSSLHDSVSENKKLENKKAKTDKHVTTTSKCGYISSQANNEIMSDSDSVHIFTIDDPKVKLGYSLVSEECTQVNFSDLIADEMATKNQTYKNDGTKTVDVTVKTPNQLTKYNSEDEFDIDKPESSNRQYMHLVLPAVKASSCAQTEDKSDNSDVESVNESAATKYLKGLSPSEAAKLEIYTMVCARSTQTGKSDMPVEDASSKHDDLSQSKSEDEIEELRVVPKSRIRLQKFDIHEISHKSKSSKSIQTETNRSCKSSQYDDTQIESDINIEINKSIDRASKKTKSAKGTPKNQNATSVYYEVDKVSALEDVNSFATPVSRPTSEKYSPRKSDEGISTSHDYSADALEQASFDDSGVARQRARRKCTVGKQNVLVEHWSSESEFDGVPPRPNSADSVVPSAGRKKKSKKKEGHHSGGRKGSRHASKTESKGGVRGRSISGRRSDDSDACAGSSRAPPGPKIRARPAHHYWSSDGEETPGPQPQHGWIVGNSHKKLVTMLAHAKGRKRNNGDKLHLLD